MDINIIEPEQGVAVAADLLQQESQVEVVGCKPSAVPSDEDRLAAGISTIGLHSWEHNGGSL
jgi:phosphosulfolactate phosphohydrolase-like enzyme